VENDPMLYLLVILAGLGGGAVASRASLVGYTPNPDDTRPRKKCPFCPPIFGAVLAVIIWLLIGREAGPAGAIVTASVVSFIMGTAGGALSNIIEDVRR
jgi:Na+/proline symporter